MSGSDFPKTSISVFLPAGEASIFVTSTNNLPPAVRMGALVVNRKKDNPNGFMAIGHHLLMTDRYVDVIFLIIRFRNRDIK